MSSFVLLHNRLVFVLFGFIKHTEDREEGMDVEEGEMGDDEAPTTW